MFCGKVEDMSEAALSSFNLFNRVGISTEFIIEEGVHSHHRRIVVRGVVELEVANLFADTSERNFKYLPPRPSIWV
jgi:hypothetical protein